MAVCCDDTSTEHYSGLLLDDAIRHDPSHCQDRWHLGQFHELCPSSLVDRTTKLAGRSEGKRDFGAVGRTLLRSWFTPELGHRSRVHLTFARAKHSDINTVV